jgi:hypothetical protein
MERALSVVYRTIPLLMAAVCLSYGIYVFSDGSTSGFFIAGKVVIWLTPICYALFTAGAVISGQQKGARRPLVDWLLPISAYCAAGSTIGYGLYLFATNHSGKGYVAGHVVTGLGLITASVSTVALTTRHAGLIARNSHGTAADGPPPGAPTRHTGLALTAVPLVCALLAYGWAFYSITGGDEPNFIGGFVLLGLAVICSCLIALIATIDRQIRNAFRDSERFATTYVVAGFATLNIALGIVVLVFSSRPYAVAPGFVLIGLGLICYSIMTKVLELAVPWRRGEPALAHHLFLIPVSASVICLFTAAYLFEAEVGDSNFFVPARVLIGLGAICFSLSAVGQA